jgi:hypothetical protein
MEQFWMDFTLRVGFPIVVILAMIRGYLVPGFIYDRVVKENDRLTKLSEEEVIPLAVEGQQLLREAIIAFERLEGRARELPRGDEPERPSLPR